MTGGQNLATMETQKNQMTLDRLGALLTTGKEQTAHTQTGLDIAYADFAAQQNWEKMQTQYLNEILHGLPPAQQTTSTVSQPFNPYASFGAVAGLPGLFSTSTA